MQRRAAWILRRWRPQDREEAVAEITAYATLAYARLANQGREHVATAGSLTAFAIGHLHAGRRVGGPTNVKLDRDTWLRYLPAGQRQIAETLTTGERPSQVARMTGLSPARVSQLRRQLKSSWKRFQGEGQVMLRTA